MAFKAMLEEARIHRIRINGLDLKTIGLAPSDWLAVVGVDAETRVGLRVVRDENKAPRFLLKSSERKNEWNSDDEETRYDTGDGTVPLRGAIPRFLDRSHLICVARRDFGYWELRDQVISGIKGFHGLIPNMNMLHRLIARFLTSETDKYQNTWGRRIPGEKNWDPPLDLREKT